MRKFMLSAVFILAVSFLYAQDNTQYSIVAGANFSKIKMDIQSLSIATDMTPGFHAGLEVSSFNKSGSLRFRSGFLISQEAGKFSSFDYSGYGQDRIAPATIELFYSKVPLLVEYFPTEKFSLQGGINSDFIFGARLKDDGNKELVSGTEGWRKWVPGLTAGVNFYPVEKFGVRAAYESALLSLNKEAAETFKFRKSQFMASVHYTF